MKQPTVQEDSYTYTKWLSTNFHEEYNTNPFKPTYEDDMDIVHEYDPYDYLIPNTYEEYSAEYYENGMFDGPPNIGIYLDDEDDEVYDTTDYM
jgi:hypothetical protein